jgi:hypothetical protein
MTAIKTLLTCAAIALSAAAQAQPTQQQLIDDFSGPYIGAKVGVNVSSASGATNKPTHTTVFPGFVAGYPFNAGPVVLGAELSPTCTTVRRPSRTAASTRRSVIPLAGSCHTCVSAP